MSEIDAPIMLSALQHWSYCPRQCAAPRRIRIWRYRHGQIAGLPDSPNRTEATPT